MISENKKRLAKREAAEKTFVGRRFSKLTTMYALVRTQAYIGGYWMCRCDCGNEIEARVYDLMRGHRKSCGCGHKYVEVGDRFTRLTVIKKYVNDQGKLRYLLKCKCGNTTTATSSNLNAGRVCSCGCLKKERSAQRMKRNRVWEKAPSNIGSRARGVNAPR